MSLSSIALPGGIPTYCSNGSGISPETLFKGPSEKAEYQKILNSKGNMASGDVKVKSVNVKIFDLSDPDQVKEYEKLQKELLEKTMRMEVVVDSRKDLVHRADGTSYWMKYVEYVEFSGSGDDGSEKSGKTKSNN